MNKKRAKLLGAICISICICLCPISAFAGASTGCTNIDPGNYYTISLPSKQILTGSVTADDIIDIIITDLTGITYWDTNKEAPPYAYKNWTADNVDFDGLLIPTGVVLYLVFGNNGSSTVLVQWDLNMSNPIPGFEFMYIFFALMAIFGFIYCKRKSLL